MMQDAPALIDCALSTLGRWESKQSEPHPSFVEWRRILLERDWSTALATSEFGNQIRQSSPVGCVLPEEKRLEIIWECRGHKSKLTKEEWFRQMRDAQERLVIAEEAWNRRVLEGMDRMAVDEEYRKLIAKDLS